MQDFCPRINMLKGFFFKCQNRTFKANFLCQKLMDFIQKKSLKNINLGDHFLLKTFFLDSIFELLYILRLCPIFVELTFLVGIF